MNVVLVFPHLLKIIYTIIYTEPGYQKFGEVPPVATCSS